MITLLNPFKRNNHLNKDIEHIKNRLQILDECSGKLCESLKILNDLTIKNNKNNDKI